jgi:hypothetical protein
MKFGQALDCGERGGFSPRRVNKSVSLVPYAKGIALPGVPISLTVNPALAVEKYLYFIERKLRAHDRRGPKKASYVGGTFIVVT